MERQNLIRAEIFNLFLVLLFPILVAGVGSVMGGVVGGILAATISTGGWAYLIVATMFITWAWRKSFDEILRGAWWLPLVFSLILLPFVYLRHFSTPWATIGRVGVEELLAIGFGYFVYGFIFSFLYVCIGRYFYKKLGVWFE